jgi:glycosyltransferase involved in cell wall biosynthesis
MRKRCLFEADQQPRLGPRVPEPEPMARRRIRATDSARRRGAAIGCKAREAPYEPYTGALRTLARGFPDRHMADTPTVSIVVPTFARPAQLRRCLDGILRLEAATFSLEVIVVDDGGAEPLDTLIDSYAGGLDIRLIRQSRRGPAAARNAGVALARGAFLAFIDDDCTPAPDWLSAFVRELEQDDRRLLGGLVENALTENPYSIASEHISQFVYEYNRTGGAREPFFTTNNIALAADLFRAVGGFGTSIPSATAEDKEFCDRWRSRGHALTHVPSAVVHHAHDLTFAGFLRQHFDYGRGILAFRLIRRSRVESPLLPEPLKFYTDLVLSPMYRPSSVGRLRLAALLFAAQLATVVGALHEALTWPWLTGARATSRRLGPN